MDEACAMSRIREAGALGVIRVRTAEDLVRIARALASGGLSCLEITMTTPGALRAIEGAREEEHRLRSTTPSPTPLPGNDLLAHQEALG